MDPATDRRLSQALTHAVARFALAVEDFADACREISECSDEPELDTSDLSDPDPYRIDFSDAPLASEPWGDVEGSRFPGDSRAGTFAGSPTHEPESDFDLSPGAVFEGQDDWDCGEVLSIDQGEDRWIIACTQDPGHDGPHAGSIVWGSGSFADDPVLISRKDDDLPEDSDEGWIAAICPHGMVTGGAGYRTFEERLRVSEMLEGAGRHIVEYPVGPVIQFCSKCISRDIVEKGLADREAL